jgi:hypothetical protein
VGEVLIERLEGRRGNGRECRCEWEEMIESQLCMIYAHTHTSFSTLCPFQVVGNSKSVHV